MQLRGLPIEAKSICIELPIMLLFYFLAIVDLLIYEADGSSEVFADVKFNFRFPLWWCKKSCMIAALA